VELKGSLPYSCLPPVPIHSQFNPVHAPSFTFLYNHLNIIFPRWSLSLRSPHQNPVCTSPLPHTCYVIYAKSFFSTRSPECLIRSTDHEAPRYLVPLRPKYFPQHPTLQHHRPMFLPQWERPSFTPIQNRQHQGSKNCYRQWKFWKRKMVATDHLG